MVPNTIDIIGSATNTSTVTINNVATYRKGDYFRVQLTNDNSVSAVYLSVTNLAVRNNGTNADIMTNFTGNVFVAKTPEIFSYDADGNITNDGRWIFTWDGENRLTSLQSLATAPSGSAKRLDFAYDWRSRRINKVVSNWTGSAWTNVANSKFYYDGWNVAAQLNSTNSLSQSYMWGTDLSGMAQGAGGVGGLLAVKDSVQGAQFVCYDGNANVVALLSGTGGTASANYEYAPFGEAIRITGTMGRQNPARFSTKFVDEESDFTYYGFRYLRAKIASWLSRDPIGETGGKNLYAFVNNDGVTHYDALGLDAENYCHFSVYVLKDGVWVLLPPGGKLTGDTDAVSTGTDALGKAQAYKWIDCFNARIVCGKLAGDKSGNDVLYDPILIDAGTKNAQGFKRKCCCAIPACYLKEQRERGGWVDAQTAFNSTPPPIPATYP